MKNLITYFSIVLFLILIACNSDKEEAKIYDVTWELEYLSGPRIAFEGLFPEKKPQLTFVKETMRVQGNNGCNGYSSDFTITNKDISFGEPGPTTMMFCGPGEKFFLNTIKKVNKFSFDSIGNLNLMIDDVPMMRFKKITE